MWTLNNYTDEEVALVKALDVKYLSFGFEVGEQGTPHLQGMFVLKKEKSLSACISWIHSTLPRVANIQQVKKLHEAIEYTQKDGNFVEQGTRPMTQAQKGEANAERYRVAFEAAKDGRIEDIPADILLRNYSSIKHIQRDFMPLDTASLTSLDNYWIYGPTGTGKSRGVLEHFGEGALYRKGCDKWFDGYRGQDTVLIEDMDESHKYMMQFMKIWTDYYPFIAHSKGSMSKLRPRRFVVTSNCHPDDIWPEGTHLEAIKRRFKIIYKDTAETPVPWTPEDPEPMES